MRESKQWLFGLRLVRRVFEETLTSCYRNKNSATHFGGYFHKRKVRQSIGRKDCRGSRRLEDFLYLATQNFELFSNSHDQN
jgi:hypothetical protein